MSINMKKYGKKQNKYFSQKVAQKVSSRSNMFSLLIYSLNVYIVQN